MLTSKVITEIVENHSEFSVWTNSCNTLFKSILINREITCDTVITRHSTPVAPFWNVRGRCPRHASGLLRLWSSRCDTSRQNAQLWLCKALNCNHFSSESRDPSYPIRPSLQNVQEKFASPVGYTHGKVAKSSPKDQVERLYLWPCLVPSWCGASRAI